MGEEHLYIEESHKRKLKAFKRKLIMEKILYIAIMMATAVLMFCGMIKNIIVEFKKNNIVILETLIVMFIIGVIIYTSYIFIKDIISINKNNITNIKYATIKNKYFASSASRNSRKPQRTYYVDVVLEDGVTTMNKIKSTPKNYKSISENERALIVSYDNKEYNLIKL